MAYAVIRKCCLGPNCKYGHGAPIRTAGGYLDRRVWVVQYATDDIDVAKRTAGNWHAYEARAVEITEPLFDMLQSRSADWLREWCWRRQVGDVGSDI